MAYYYYDAQGNLGVVADVYGNSTDSYAYDAWGAIAEHSGSSDEQYTYVGKYGVSMEPDDGLLMMGVRFYDPELGVFLQKDPFPGYLVDPTTLHPYMYTRNDPVNKIDPTGENWFTDKWNEYVAKPAESIYNSVASAANKGKEKVSRGIANAREIYQKFQEKRQARWKNAGARGKERAAAQGTRKDTGILNRINERFFGGQLNQLNNRYIAPYGEDIASGVVSITPGVGDAKDWQEVITARDLVTNKELSTFDQGVTVFAAFLPLVGGKVVREILGEGVESFTKNADVFEGMGKGADFYVTPKGDVVPGTKSGFNDNLSKMTNQNGKYVGEGSIGQVRVRVEDAHPQSANVKKPSPDHDVPHVHAEHRKNGQTGPWGEGDPTNNISFPQDWLK